MKWFLLAYGIYLTVYSFFNSVSGSLERHDAMIMNGVGVVLIGVSEIVDLLKEPSQ